MSWLTSPRIDLPRDRSTECSAKQSDIDKRLETGMARGQTRLDVIGVQKSTADWTNECDWGTSCQYVVSMYTASYLSHPNVGWLGFQFV